MVKRVRKNLRTPKRALEPAAESAIFFDLGDTLGTPVLSPPPVHLTEFHVFPFVPSLLTSVKARRSRLGIISNTGDDPGQDVDRILQQAGLLAFFDDDLRIYSKDVGKKKDSPEIFRLAAKRAGLKPSQCVFVGEDSSERQFAVETGMRVAPHPLLVPEVLDNVALRYVRVTIPSEQVDRALQVIRTRSFVPVHLAGKTRNVVFGITSQRVATELVNMRLSVDLLGAPGLPEQTDLFLFRDDLASETGFLSSEGQTERFFGGSENSPLLLSAIEEGLLVALPPNRSLSEFHFVNARHGHTVRLLPDPQLLEPASPSARFQTSVSRSFEPAAVLTAVAREAFRRITPDNMLDRIERYSGKRSVSTSDPNRIVSRHISHLDNALAMAAIAQEFQNVGRGRLSTRLVKFTHRGQSLHNVEAELKGVAPELVLVTAHLDSTAGNDPDYDERHGAAPGADDDASGMAGVLALAECMVELCGDTPPARTLRFVLFNAEEEGLVGSQVYARQQRSLGAPIVGVFQMDMIGHHQVAPQSWEVHVGFRQSSDVEVRSMRLAEVLRQVTPLVSPALEIPQVYRSATTPDGDPAAGRSDHASFHAQGYAACVVSEDFFVGPGTDAPEPQGNPNYHSAGDTLVNAEFAADIARAVGAAAWIIATGAEIGDPAFSGFGPVKSVEESMPEREIDTRRMSGGAARAATKRSIRMGAKATNLKATQPASTHAAVAELASGATPAAGQAVTGSYVDRALSFLRSERAPAAAFAAPGGDVSEFVPDPVVQRTSAGAAAVHLHQQYRGVPVFQMAHMVRFAPAGEPIDAQGESAVLSPGLDVLPQRTAAEAVLRGAQHLAATGDGRVIKDEFGETSTLPEVSIDGFKPQVIAAFSTLPAQPAVLDWVPDTGKGKPAARAEKPFENAVPAHLVIFNEPAGPRLAWHMIFTLPAYSDQYVVIVSADGKPGDILYSRSKLHRASASGTVFEFSPSVADRRAINFPRPISEYPVMPATPLVGFPADWIEADQTIGNSTRAMLNFTSSTLKGAAGASGIEFRPADRFGDDQKLLNIFYFCNYMHDFLYILGFDEAAGNFQQINFTHTGIPGDPVRAHAHSGAVNGTANMSTAEDGRPPVMNMGLVTRSGRHTAFDADVVFHEYTHGLTNRLVGGLRDGNALDAPQSSGMGEGWSDFFALTVQNYFRALAGQPEKTVTGDWVVDNPRGIRKAPYDDNYPFGYGDIASFERDPRNNLPDEHETGEIWCAALMMLARKIRTALGSQTDGYRLAWQVVVDGLKLTKANPSFLDARDAILMAIDQLEQQRRISRDIHRAVKRAAWQSFAHFGMGASAMSEDAGVDGITADNTLPADV